MTHTITLDDIKAEIEEYANPKAIPDTDCRRFKAQMFPIVSGWDAVIDDSLDIEKELVGLIQLAIEGRETSWGEKPETVIGRKLVACALKRVVDEFDDLISEADERRMMLEDSITGEDAA